MVSIETIWHQLNDKLLAFIKQKVTDKAIAEDILQEVFIRIHSKIDTLADDTKLQSWIYQITRNLIADYYRSQKRVVDQKDITEDTIDDNSGSEVMEEAVQDMIKFMDEMPAEHCDAICATEIDGMSIKDYADKKGISYPAAKARVQRSRKLLKDMMMNCCHYQFDKYGTVVSIAPKHCCCCCSDV